MFSATSWFSSLGVADGAFVVALLGGVTLSLVSHRRARRARLVSTAAFGTYLVLLAAVVFCPLPVNPPSQLFIGDPDRSAVAMSLDLSLFSPWSGRLADNQDLMNILLTVPFGFGLPWVVRWRPRALLAACVALAVVLESLQVSVSWVAGWSYRAGDVNDLLANLLGALLGLACFAGLTQIHPQPPGSRSVAGGRVLAVVAGAVAVAVVSAGLVGASRFERVDVMPSSGKAPEGTRLATGRSVTSALYAALLEVAPGTGSQFQGQDLDPSFPKVHGQLRFVATGSDESVAHLVSVDVALEQLVLSEYETVQEALACDSSMARCQVHTLGDGSVVRTSRESGSAAAGDLVMAERLVDGWYVAVTSDGAARSTISVDQLRLVVSQPWWSLYLPERFFGVEDVPSYAAL